MGLLIYSCITSLDGYVCDEHGSFDWSVPDEKVHTFINELERPVGTYLYGRRLYEVMRAWEAVPAPDLPREIRDYARIWQAARKIVFSRTLRGVSGTRTELVRDFDAGWVRQLKTRQPQDLLIGGPELAGQALRAGLVDEIHQFLSPVVVGAGTPFLPGKLRLELKLLNERRFGNGVVFLRYGLAPRLPEAGGRRVTPRG